MQVLWRRVFQGDMILLYQGSNTWWILYTEDIFRDGWCDIVIGSKTSVLLPNINTMYCLWKRKTDFAVWTTKGLHEISLNRMNLGISSRSSSFHSSVLAEIAGKFHTRNSTCPLSMKPVDTNQTSKLIIKEEFWPVVTRVAFENECCNVRMHASFSMWQTDEKLKKVPGIVQSANLYICRKQYNSWQYQELYIHISIL